MLIRGGRFCDMAQEITESGKRIVLFGAGVIGTVIVPEILDDFQLAPYVECYIDNEVEKWNSEVNSRIGRKKIFPPEHLGKLGSNIVVLMNISRYAEALRQLEQMECTDGMVCYIIPMMCILNFKQTGGQGVLKEGYVPKIPKKLHYMWLGGKAMPEKLQKCIESWRRYCPDYEIIKWDESNYDIKKNLYMKQAYEQGAYGFVPDYARLDILYRQGGIYMDTDVEVIKNLDDLLFQEAFCGVEKWQCLNFGGCSGAAAGCESIRKFIEKREDVMFVTKNGNLNKTTCGFYDTATALELGYKINGKNQKIKGMTIYTSDYFHPYDYMTGQTEITDDTFCVHHFDGGWLDNKMRLANENAARQFNALYKRVAPV